MARSRRPFVVAMSGAFRSGWTCRRASEFAGPDADRLSRLSRGAMPAASSGASRSLSVAETASGRRADAICDETLSGADGVSRAAHRACLQRQVARVQSSHRLACALPADEGLVPVVPLPRCTTAHRSMWPFVSAATRLSWATGPADT